jgi:beta-glucosidase
MNLEEKVAQMRMFHASLGIRFDENDSLFLPEGISEKLESGIGGIKNPGEHYSPERAAILNNLLQKYILDHSRLKIPAFFVCESYDGADGEGNTRIGRPINMAATFNRDLVKGVYDVVGREARLRGLHLTHGPEADIVRDPRFGRMSESFGEDTYLTTEMIVSVINGMQGDGDGDGLSETHMGAVVKHFAGYGQVSGGTNFASIEISPRTLVDEVFPPFKAAIQKANALGVMASHGDINGIASHANHELLTNVLRNEWGFDGYVVSDANDIGRLHYFMKVAETPEDAAILALKAGVDVDLYAEDAYALLPKIVKEKPELLSYIDEAVRRVLRTKFKLGLFDNPYVDVAKAAKNVNTEDKIAISKAADEESIILLKNEKLLPLNNDEKLTVALVGPLLNKNTQADFERISSSKVRYISEKGFQLTNGERNVPELSSKDKNQSGIKAIIKTAKNANVIVLFVGGDKYTSKEAYFSTSMGDRDNIDPVGQQDELLFALKKLNKPIVVVLKHRRTLSINAIAENADAIVDCWDLSDYGDLAIAKVIFGEINPSGKLPVTVPRSIGQLPFHYSQKEINYKKGYLFTQNTPLFPFGYGLSYSRFEYSNFQLSDSILILNSKMYVSVDVTNSSDVAGKEVVQLYIKDIIGSVVRPQKELKNFQKISLDAGETKTISFVITPDMLAFTGVEMTQVVEPGDYQVMIGGSSDDLIIKSFQLKK